MPCSSGHSALRHTSVPLPIAGRDPAIALCGEGIARLIEFRLRGNSGRVRCHHGLGAVNAHRTVLIIHKDVRL